jgi:hypothetical protein
MAGYTRAEEKAVLTLLVFGVIGLMALWIVSPPTRRATRSFWCPYVERNVTTEFDEEVLGDRRVNVARCSAFSPPTTIGCDLSCLWLRRLPAQRSMDAARSE